LIYAIKGIVMLIPSRLLFVASALFIATPAVGGQVEDCAKVVSSTERLACYDLATGRTPEAISPKGRWTITDKKNPIDDTTTRVAYIEADGTSRSVTLFARCMSSKTEVYITRIRGFQAVVSS
jgi:hypothetical protein